MTLDLVFIGATTGRRTLAQLAAELGLTVDHLGSRAEASEIFGVSIVSVRLAGEPAALDAAPGWFARRGIHRLAA